MPLAVLALFAIFLGFAGTPAWPWFEKFLEGGAVEANFAKLIEGETLGLMVLSSVIVLAGLTLGWWVYGRKPLAGPTEPDVLERARPDIFKLLKNKYYFDEIYQWSVVSFNAWWARVCDKMDALLWNGVVHLVSLLVLGLSWFNGFIDEYVVNPGFDEGCRRVAEGGGLMSRLQDGRVQHYLRIIGVAMTVLVLVLIWGCRPS